MSTPRTIRRTTPAERRYTVVLSAASDDAGPYYLTDAAGYGVSWVQAEWQTVEVDRAPNASVLVGVTSTRHRTWVPVFHRARLAFELCALDPTVTVQEAKAAADKTFATIGLRADRVAFAFGCIEAARARTAAVAS